MKDELRAMANRSRNPESLAMMSSAIPSEKYSCLGSPLMLAKGSMAI